MKKKSCSLRMDPCGWPYLSSITYKNLLKAFLVFFWPSKVIFKNFLLKRTLQYTILLSSTVVLYGSLHTYGTLRHTKFEMNSLYEYRGIKLIDVS